jgi:hypothetical protein
MTQKYIKNYDKYNSRLMIPRTYIPTMRRWVEEVKEKTTGKGGI